MNQERRLLGVPVMSRLSVLFVILFVFTALLSSGCSEKNKEEAAPSNGEKSKRAPSVTMQSEAIKEIGLTTVTAESKPVMGSITATAKLVPNQDLEAQVGSLVQGRVQKVMVSVGDQVQQGQVLMLIESMEIGSVLAEFVKAKAELRSADANLKRQKSLNEDNAGSQKSLLEAQTEYEKAFADFSAEEKRIHSIGLSKADVQDSGIAQDAVGVVNNGVLPVKAPIAGTVVERTVVIGQAVDATSMAFRIVNTSTLWADGQIYENDAQRLTGKPEVTLTLTAIPGEVFRGRVIFVSPVVDENTRTITIRASIPNPTGRLKPQMFGEIHIPFGGSQTGIVIPAEAVIKDNTNHYVFVATSETTFERRDVQLGVAFDSQLEIKSGLNAGERVVVKGAFQLKSELLKEAFGGEE